MPFLTQGKTNWKFLLIVVVLAVIVGGGIWFLSAPRPEQSLTPEEPVIPEEEIVEEVEDETADWQTSKDEIYGFEIKIPSSWEITEYGNKIWTFEFQGPNLDDYCNLQGHYWIDEVDLMKEAESYFPNKTTEITHPFEFNGYQGIKVKTADSEYVFITSRGFVYNFSLGSSNICDKIFSTFRFIESTTEPIPVIDSISPDSGPVETLIEIRGKNFSGFEGDLNAWIENTEGVKGIIYGETDSNDNLIKFTLNSSYCQIDTSYSGLACPDFIYLAPGTYKIYVMPWGQKSNEVIFTVTSQ